MVPGLRDTVVALFHCFVAVIKYHGQSNPEKKGLLFESTLGYDSGGLESVN